MNALKFRSILSILSLAVFLSYSGVQAEETGAGSTSSSQSQQAPSAMSQTSQGGGGDTVLPDAFTGTMSYSVPIQVPAGRNGMDPGLSLLYRSSNGNGWVGVGWELEVGAIERSIKGGVDYNGDKFIFRMAGGTSELVYVGDDAVGRVYKAKIEGAFNRFRKIGTGANTYWEVTDKKGTKYTFGETFSVQSFPPRPDRTTRPPLITTSRLFDPDDSSRIFKWGLEKVEDTFGNTMTLSYSVDQGQLYLNQINYPYNNYVKFYHEGRDDAPVMYITNFAVKTAYRLKTIEVVANGTKVRAYKLRYQDCSSTGRSLLASVQQFGKDYGLDGSGTVTGETTMPVSSFSYSASNGFEDKGYWINNAYSGWSDSNATARTHVMDVNGDGRSDIVLGPDANGKWYVMQSTGTGFEDKHEWISGAYSNWASATNRTYVMDVNGDGRSDIVLGPDANGNWYVLQSTGTGFEDKGAWISGAYGGWDGAADRIHPMDVNGDGKIDIVLGPDAYGKWYVLQSTGTSFEDKGFWISGAYSAWADSNGTMRTHVMDVDGDGRSDLILGPDAYGKWYVMRSTATSFEDKGEWISGAYTAWFDSNGVRRTRVMDVNGDGRADIVFGPDNGGNWYVMESTGTSFVDKGSWISGAYSAWEDDNGSRRTRVMDVNGDGRADIVFGPDSGGNWYVMESTGTSFVDRGSWISGVYSAWQDSNGSRRTRVMDVSGDGRTDIVIGPDADGKWYVVQPSGNNPDLLTSIQNGLGATTTITYTPSTVYQNTQLPFPIQTVSSVTTDDGNGNVFTSSYSYSGGYFHIGEKDFRGFRYVKVTSPAMPDGAVPTTETWFHQGNGDINNPNVETGYMKGKPYKVKSSSSRFTGYSGWYNPTFENLNYSITETTYTALTTTPYYFAPPTSVSTSICNGRLDGYGYPCGKVLKAEYIYDSTYGNVIEERQHGDYLTEYWNYGYSGYVFSTTSDDRTTARTYALNPSKWIIGLPASETVYEGIGTIGTKKAETKYYYDYAGMPTDCSDVSANIVPDKGKVTRVERWKYDSLHPDVPGVMMESGRMAYDSYGNLKCSKDAKGNKTSIVYDTATNTFPRFVTNAANHTVETIYYDGGATDKGLYGQVKSVIDPNGAPTTTEYDALGRRTRTILPDGYSTTSYEEFGTVGAQHTRTDTSAGLSSWTYFDGLGRKIIEKSTGPDGKIVASQTIYDNRGRVKQTSLPYFEGDPPKYATYTYDILGRVIQADNPDSTRSLACYYNWTTTTIDANNHAKTDTKDAFGRLVRVDEYSVTYTTCSTNPGTPYATTNYQYDVLGNLLNVTDAKSNVTTMTYDTLGRKVYMKDPDMGQWYYEYDNAGNLTSQHDSMQPNNQWIYFQYDALNRLVQKDYGTDTVTGPRPLGDSSADVVYTYDDTTVPYGKGRLKRMKDLSGSTDYYYNIMGQVAQAVKTVKGDDRSFATQYSYDQAGRPLSITYPDPNLSTVKYIYNGPLLAAVYDGTTTYATYSGANALGQPGSITYGNNVKTDFTYYPNNYRLNTIVTGAYQNLTYGYDNVGNVKQITDPLNATYSYDYDELNRLKVAYKNGLQEITYTYDTIGNMTYNSQIGTYTYPTNGIRPHAVANAGSFAYTYDNNGNMRTGAGRTITPDPENRPGTIIANGMTATFDYDGNGERVKKTTNSVSTIYIGKLYECVGTTCYKYIFANGQRIVRKTVGTAETRYYHTDHLGSSSIVTDETGSKAEGIAYYPYGASRDDTGPANMRHKFTGQELDGETGLYFYNARYYDPALGRFISADSIIPDPSDPQAYNRYSYVGNNPVRYTDPSGHWSFDVGDWHISGSDKDIGTAAIVTATAVASWYCGGCAAAGVLQGALAGEIGGGAYAAATGGDIQQGVIMGGITGGTIGYFTGPIVASEPQYSMVADGLNKTAQAPTYALQCRGDWCFRGGLVLIGGGAAVSGGRNGGGGNVPPSPPSVDVHQNIQEASQHYGNLSWFYDKVHTGGIWDYKQAGYPRQYEKFGNFNYGATGRALGVPAQVLLRSAGTVQLLEWRNWRADFGVPWGGAPYGDDPDDQTSIRGGINYYDTYYGR